jgi:hypothetical protein
MPYTFVRDDLRRRLTVTTSGALTLAEMLSVVERQASEGVWTFGVLYVAEDVTTFPQPEEMRALVARVETLAATLGPRGPIAIVDPREAGFGMWRLYSFLADDIRVTVHVFRDLPSADTWLSSQ